MKRIHSFTLFFQTRFLYELIGVVARLVFRRVFCVMVRLNFQKRFPAYFFFCMPPYLPLLHLVQSWTFNCSRNIGNCYAWRISTPFVGNRTMAMIDMSFSHMWCVCVSVVGVIIYYFQKNVLHFHRIEMPCIHMMVNYHLYCRRTSDLWWT